LVKQTPKTLRSLPDRIRHTIFFEFTSLISVTPLACRITGHTMGEIGVLALWISGIAMLWNAIYNALFDRIEIRCGSHLSQRDWRVRVLHAFGFEIGLALFTVPLIAYWLSLSLWQALLLDMGFAGFYLIFSLGFNWAYDRIFPVKT